MSWKVVFDLLQPATGDAESGQGYRCKDACWRMESHNRPTTISWHHGLNAAQIDRSGKVSVNAIQKETTQKELHKGCVLAHERQQSRIST
eukprot:m.116068 g.116068  ORF g.116068 m.116068 type:complete len:90 (+) comp28475_c0_seq2:421-690(+)